MRIRARLLLRNGQSVRCLVANGAPVKKLPEDLAEAVARFVALRGGLARTPAELASKIVAEKAENRRRQAAYRARHAGTPRLNMLVTPEAKLMLGRLAAEYALPQRVVIETLLLVATLNKAPQLYLSAVSAERKRELCRRAIASLNHARGTKQGQRER